MNKSSSESAPANFDELLDMVLVRHRGGENPDLETLCSKYPEFADDIRNLLPSILLMEKVKLELEANDGQVVSFASAPQRIGDYKILREIGRGGMGIVYEAEQESLGRHVALKILPFGATGDGRAAKRFLREARTAAQLHHSNIVPVFEVGQEGDTAFYTMQLIRGQSLDVVIQDLRRIRSDSKAKANRIHETDLTPEKYDSVSSTPNRTGSAEIAASFASGNFEAEQLGDNPPGNVGSSQNGSSSSDLSSESVASLPGGTNLSSADSQHSQYWHSVARIGLQVAEALAYSHERGIVHRDIKPSNLILDPAGTIWVTDFGLARIEDDSITQTGDILGTLRYMPPEQLKGNCDERSDVYSLGITLYELLVLKPAFHSTNRLKLIEMVSSTEPIAPRVIDPRIPRDMETIVLKASDKNPKARYESSKDLAEDLRRFISDEPIEARRISLPERFVRWSRRNKQLATSLILVALLLVVTTVGSIISANYYRYQEKVQTELANSNKTLATEKQAEAERATMAEQRIRRNLYAAEMKLAGEYLHYSGGPKRVEEMTEDWRPQNGVTDLRGWEWYYLRSHCNREELDCKDNLEPFIWSVSWHPDGTRFASSDSIGNIKIWNSSNGELLKTIQRKSGQTRSVRWSQNGKYFAAAIGNTIGVFDIEADDWQFVIPDAHEEIIWCVDWSPNGTQLASAGKEGAVKIWDISTRQVIQTFDKHSSGDAFVAWNPAGQTIASVGGDNVVHVWNATTGDEIHRLVLHTDLVQEVSWSHDGKRLATASRDHTVKLWDVIDGELIWSILGRHQVMSVKWDPTGQWLATGSWDGSLGVISVDSKNETHTIAAHFARIGEVAWSPDGKRIASTSLKGGLKVWSSFDSLASHALWGSGPNHQFSNVAWSPDGSHIAAAKGNEIFVWDESGTMPHQLLGHTHLVEWICWSPDGTEIASASMDGSARTWDVATGETIRVFDEGQRVRSIAWSPKGERLAYSMNRGGVKIQTIAGKLIRKLPENAVGKLFLAWSPDGTRLATASKGFVINIWNLTEGRVIGFLSGHTGQVYDVRWSPDGRRLASGGQDRVVRIWDVATGKVVFAMNGHSRSVRNVCWSPDGQRLGSASDDGTVRIWDASTGNATLTLAGHQDAVKGLDWSSDGKRLVSASWDKTVRIWDASVGYEREP